MSLMIAQELLESIREHGKRAYPNECCGVLLGRIENSGKAVVKLRPMENAREDSPRNRYLISPRDLLDAEKAARALGLDIVGVYHSHPDHPARPSEFDREHAFPWYSYIIVSVRGGEPLDLTSWTLRDDRTAFDAEDLNSS
jgi:proteasome lid subunit RPN8/RPN11